MPVNIKKLLAFPVFLEVCSKWRFLLYVQYTDRTLERAVWKATHRFALKSFSSVVNAQILSAYLRNKYGSVQPGDLVAGPYFVHLAFLPWKVSHAGSWKIGRNKMVESL